MHFKVSAVLPIPADLYFVERDSSAFRSLVARMSNLESLEMGKSWREDNAEVYEFITKPDIEKYVPKQFKHFIPGGNLDYVDIIRYEPQCIAQSPYRMHVKSVPPLFHTKAKIESWLTIEEETETTSRQTLEGNIHIKIIGLGHIAERIVVDNLKNVYKHVPQIVERWVAFRNEVLKQPNGRDVLIAGRPQNAGVEWINDTISNILKEDLQSEASTSEGSSQYPLPSPEEMEGYSTETSSAVDDTEGEEDDDVYFDARDQTSWLDMRQFLAENKTEGNLRLEQQLERDTRDASTLLNQYTKTGRRLKNVHVEESTPVDNRPTTAKDLLAGESKRFSDGYNQELQEWDTFWQKQQVPQVKSKHLRQRLANVFRIGAESGLVQPQKAKKEKQYRVPWLHRHKHKKAHHQDESIEQALGESLTLQDNTPGRVAQNESKASQKGHSRSRSAEFAKNLFTRSKSRDKHQQEQ